MKARGNRLSKQMVACVLAAVLIAMFSPNRLNTPFVTPVIAQGSEIWQSSGDSFYDVGRGQYYYEVYTSSPLFTLVDRVYMQPGTDIVAEVVHIGDSINMSSPLEFEPFCAETCAECITAERQLCRNIMVAKGVVALAAYNFAVLGCVAFGLPLALLCIAAAAALYLAALNQYLHEFEQCLRDVYGKCSGRLGITCRPA